MYKVIVISRQFGSGGRTIGKLTAEKLGIPCYDKEIIEKVSQNCGFAKDFVESQGEYANHRTWLGRALEGSNRFEGMNNQDKIWVEQRKFILEVSQNPCVIVGRCADSILKDRQDVLKVFIHADDCSRAERIVKLYGEKADKPEKRLKDKDKRRAAYYKCYTDAEWGVASNYHIALDSGKLGVEKCAELFAHIFKEG